MRRLVERFRIPGYTRELIEQVTQRTGYPLFLIEEDGIGYDSELRVARCNRAVHEIAYVPEYREYRMHFLVNGAFKILRFWEVPEDQRYMPAHQVGRKLPEEDHAELLLKLQGVPRSVLEDLSAFLYTGIARQLTSMPVDIRVERELAEAVPDHRPAQASYLRRQVKDLEPAFAPELQELSPERLHRASTAMNVVLAEEAAEFSGEPVGKMFRETPCRALGERLREQLHSVEVAGYPGDRVLTDMWARELGMEDWYKWVRME